MAWFQVHNKLLLALPHVPHHRFSTSIIVLLVLMILCPLLLSSSHAKPCKCSSSDDGDRRDNITINTTLDKKSGYIFVPGLYNNLSLTLDSYKNKTSGTEVFNLSVSNGCYFVLPESIELWEKSIDGTILHEASFTVSFSMSVVYPSSNNKQQQQQQQQVGGSSASSLYFGILPTRLLSILLAPPSSGSLNSSLTSATRTVAGRNVSINIRLVDHATATTPLSNNGGTFTILSDAVFIEISIQPPESSSGEMSSSYTVWIDYERDRQQLSVYAIDAGKPKPDSPIVNISRSISNMTSTGYFFGSSFGLFSSLDQLMQIHTWESTVEALPSLDQSRGMSTVSIVAVAVGPSLAIAAAVATIVYCYFNSKYRTWKKDLDQLAKSMQSLPGVPIQVNFRDIQKATYNFHETTKLGRGGFGAVYRCRLPAPVKGGGEALDVAVKKFTRDDNRRYEDFLAEVSIINQLRHKNIVPLIGWSYNKGEPLLVYEYMPNGSLDQHLFSRSGDRQQRSPLCQWETRYNIVMDVATGLQYVHHEYEPMVLHRDIKASNIMIDSAFHGRLGDFGLACTVDDMGKNSYTERGDGPLGTYGFIPYDYIHSGRATRKTDIFAFGVLILETVTGKPALGNPQFDHITDWVWHLHRQGKLLDAVDPVFTTDQQFDSNNAKRLLLLGLACSSPNPSERPSMMEALQVITKLAPPPDVPLEKPRFVLPPEEECNPISSDYSRTTNSNLERSSTTVVEMAARRHVSFQSFENAGNSFHHRPIIGHSQDQEYSVHRTA